MITNMQEMIKTILKIESALINLLIDFINYSLQIEISHLLRI